MTSIRPADYPSPTKTGQLSSGSKSPKSPRSPKSPVDPFSDPHERDDPHDPHTCPGHSEFSENLTCSAQEERFPVYSEDADAERQPLLDYEGQQRARGAIVGINMAAGIFLGLLVSVVIVVHLVRESGSGSVSAGEGRL